MYNLDTVFVCPNSQCDYEGLVLNDHYACPLCKYTLKVKSNVT